MMEPLRAAFRYCKWLTARSGSNFSSSFLLLPPPRRRAMEAVYAFCRAMDDIVDSPSPTPSPLGGEGRVRGELQRWRKELIACRGGFPAHPIAVALQSVQSTYNIPWEYFEKLITGVEMDLGRRRYGTFEELKVYCEHVASVVGLISVRVFGCRHPDADRYASDLGIALQLTNILRDLKADASAGRIYLPAEDLRRFGVSEADLLAVIASPSEARAKQSQFQALMVFQAERARGYFDRARQALRSSGEGRKLLPARIMGGVYARLLRRIQESGYDVFSRRARVPPAEQLSIAFQCLVGIC